MGHRKFVHTSKPWPPDIEALAVRVKSAQRLIELKPFLLLEDYKDSSVYVVDGDTRRGICLDWVADDKITLKIEDAPCVWLKTALSKRSNWEDICVRVVLELQ